MSILNESQQWYRMPTAVFLIGALSIGLLLWGNRINHRQQMNFLVADTILGAQVNVATGHLWLEEALSGDATAKEALAAMDQAIFSVNSTLNGGKNEYGLILNPVEDPALRSRLEVLKAMTLKFKVLARERLRNPTVAGVGSIYDQQFDALFKDILSKASALGGAVEESNVKDQLKTGRIFLGILLAWAFTVAAATAGLWSREKRRKSAEDALFDAHEQLLVQAEELTAHRERLTELVEMRTSELTAANELLRDEIAERKNLQYQLFQSQKMEGIGQLAGGVAHDFNNILTAIIGYGNLAELRLKDDETTMQYLEQILAAADRAAHLTQGLLAFSRKQIFTLQPANVNGIVIGVEKMLGRLISEEIELQTRLSQEDLIVMVDSGQIGQVIINLATNARDAMPDGGSLIIETNRFAMTEDYCNNHGFGAVGNYALLTVSDSGHGIDEASQARIFEPFFTTKDAGKGTGLGLSIVYGIIKQHNGFVTVYSEAGHGTTFKIYLLLADGEAAPKRLVEGMGTVAGGDETVLVVEDNAEVRNLTRLLLEQSGYRVIEAVDGQDAVARFGAHRDEIKLVIMDVVLPKMNGNETLLKMQSVRPEVVALFTSGYTEEVIHKKGVLMEDFHFISKPAPPQALLRKVRELLDAVQPTVQNCPDAARKD